MGAPPAVQEQLEASRDAIARKWYQAIADTCYPAKSAGEVRRDLQTLTGKVIDLLVGAQLDSSEAEGIGVALARLHYIQAEALGQSLRVLGEQLYYARPIEGAEAYLARLAKMLGAMATGFFREACRTVLAEQETIRAALVTEIEESRQALLEVHEELEQRVVERTADLARTNRELRVEVAERRRIESALRESEEKYRRLVEDMSEVVYVTDRNGRLTYVSPSVEAVLGYSPIEAIGRNFAEFVHREDLPRMRAGFASLLAGHNQTSEYRMVAASGEACWVLTFSSPVVEGSRVVGVHGLLTNITERKLAQEALKASEERWRLLVQNAPVLVLTVGPDLQIRFINRSPAEQVSWEDLLGRNMLAYIRQDYADVVATVVSRVLETGLSDYLEVPVVGSTRRDAWYGIHFGPLRREDRVVEVMLVARDITEQKKVAEMKDNLIRDVSHEMRTPLAKVQMSLELLVEMLEEEDLDRERAIRISGFAIKSSQRLLQTMENILDLSRLESGMWPYDRAIIQPDLLIREAVLYVAAEGALKGIELLADLPPSLPSIRGDWDKLSRVLSNLLDNAIKYSEAGRIVVSAEPRDGMLVVSVADQGQGILSENLEKVFQRFFQEKTRHFGAGLGLAICRAIVEEHGGRIWAESAGRGLGATVHFTLPTIDGDEEAA
jgi:PAS domain S-box-containing protein